MFAESPTRKRHYEETSHATPKSVSNCHDVCQLASSVMTPMFCWEFLWRLRSRYGFLFSGWGTVLDEQDTW